ncbi:MAG: DUF1499 domain-containing protein [Gammaproteobacteria bacterium]
MQSSKIIVLLLKLIAGLAVLNVLVIIGAIAGRLVFDWVPFSAFIFLFRGIPIGLGFAALGLVIVLAAVYKKHAPARTLGLVTLLAGLAPIGGTFAMVGPIMLGPPMIHDISTDLSEPPEFVVAKTLRSAHENPLDHEGEKVASQQRQAYPDIAPLQSDLNPQEAFSRALGTAQKLKWTVTREDADQGVIEAYDKTTLFGFIDDIAIRIRPGAAGSRIDVRSVSRVGLSDVGKNAARIRTFMESFNSG